MKVSKAVERHAMCHSDVGVVLPLPELESEELVCVFGTIHDFYVRPARFCDSEAFASLPIEHKHRLLLYHPKLGLFIRFPELKDVNRVYVRTMKKDPLFLEVIPDGVVELGIEEFFERTIGGLHVDDLLQLVNEYWDDYQVLEWKVSDDGYHYDLKLAPRGHLLKKILDEDFEKLELGSNGHKVLNPFDRRFRLLWDTRN